MSEQQVFIYRLNPGTGEDYDYWHTKTFPAAIEQLRRAGFTEYRIYRRDDLVITVARQDPALAATTPESPELVAGLEQWSQVLAHCFAEKAEPDGSPLFAAEVFDLDDYPAQSGPGDA